MSCCSGPSCMLLSKHLLVGRLTSAKMMFNCSAGAECFAALGISKCHKCIETIDLTNCHGVGVPHRDLQQPSYMDHLGNMRQLKGGEWPDVSDRFRASLGFARGMSRSPVPFVAGLHLGGTHIAGFFAGLKRKGAARIVIAGLTVLDISDPRPSTDPLALRKTRARTQERAASEPAEMLRIVACLLRNAVSLRSLTALGMQQLVQAAGKRPLAACLQPACLCLTAHPL